MAEQKAVDEGTVHDWAVNAGVSCGSDHAGVKWVIDHGRKEINNIAGLRYNFKSIEPKEWREAFEPRFWEVEARLAPLLSDNTLLNKQLEEIVTMLYACFDEGL